MSNVYLTDIMDIENDIQKLRDEITELQTERDTLKNRVDLLEENSLLLTNAIKSILDSLGANEV